MTSVRERGALWKVLGLWARRCQNESMRVSCLVLLASLWGTSTWAESGRKNLPRGWEWPPSPDMRKQGLRCLERLDELGVEWKKARRTPNVVTPITVPDMSFGGLRVEPIFRKGPFVMDCHLAVALARVAPEVLRAGVETLRFSSIHDFRRAKVNGELGEV